jgi:glycine betaine/proline transport system substrate-binding protein
MKKKSFNLVIGLLLVVLFVGELVYSLRNTELSGRASGETIQLVHIPYDTDMASTEVMAIVLEEVGYNVRTISVDNAIMYNSLANGESDASTTAWLPVSQGTTYQAYEDDIVNLGPNLEGAESGLAVPEYMDVDSMDELTDEANQTIIGIEPGAGITSVTEEAIEIYDNLNGWELETPSTGAMLASAESAVRNQEEVVITAWRPHWMFEQYGLKLLDDPKNVYGDAEGIYSLTREGFAEDYPEANQILDNFYWEPEDMNSITYAMENGVDTRTTAQNWVDDNPEKVKSWLEGVVDSETIDSMFE